MSAYYEGLLAFAGINMLLALSVYATLATGQLSIGNAGFMAVGAYVSAVLTVSYGWPLILALVVGMIVASIVGVLIGFPALRFKGLYLVIATLGFGEMIRTFFLAFEPTGAAMGFRGPTGSSLTLIMGSVILVLLIFWVINRSRIGLAFDAVENDEMAANIMGINLTVVKVSAFGFGAAIAGLGGGLYAHYVYYIEPSNFCFLLSTMMVLFVLLGGRETPIGPLVGAVIFTFLPELLRFTESMRLSVYGGLIILLMIVRPEGLISRSMLTWLSESVASLFVKLRRAPD